MMKILCLINILENPHEFVHMKLVFALASFCFELMIIFWASVGGELLPGIVAA